MGTSLICSLHIKTRFLAQVWSKKKIPSKKFYIRIANLHNYNSCKTVSGVLGCFAYIWSNIATIVFCSTPSIQSRRSSSLLQCNRVLQLLRSSLIFFIFSLASVKYTKSKHSFISRNSPVHGTIAITFFMIVWFHWYSMASIFIDVVKFSFMDT